MLTIFLQTVTISHLFQKMYAFDHPQNLAPTKDDITDMCVNVTKYELKELFVLEVDEIVTHTKVVENKIEALVEKKFDHRDEVTDSDGDTPIRQLIKMKVNESGTLFTEVEQKYNQQLSQSVKVTDEKCKVIHSLDDVKVTIKRVSPARIHANRHLK